MDAKLEAFVDRLQGVRKNGDGFVAKCPAHQDKSPSLSIGLGHRGVVFHCFAGCDPDDVIAKLELRWSDLFLDGSTPNTKIRRRDWRAIELESYACVRRLQEREPKVLERLRFGRGWAARALEKLMVGWDGSRLTLPVRSADLKLHDVLRYDPFAKTRKVLAGKGKSRLPWPAPEFVDARVLFLVEGEGTAISMASVGFAAVALPGSVSRPTTSITRPGSWQGAGWHPKWAERLKKFRTVVCLPDCDQQGRALMRAASYDLAKVGVDVHVVDIGPKSQDGRDIADHLLKNTFDLDSRRAAREAIRELVAEEAEVLVA